MSDSILGSLRQPEYTGANRCMACTAVNAVITGGLGVLVAAGLAAGTAVGAAAAVAAGAAILAVGAAAIYLRGYLVPGTPALTKRYFPPWLLALFGKATGEKAGAPRMSVEDLAGGGPIGVADGTVIDPEAALLDAGALELDDASQQLRLSESFRDGWQAKVERLRDEPVEVGTVLDALNVERVVGGVELVEDEDQGEMLLRLPDAGPDGLLAIWESSGALRADLATSAQLSEMGGEYDAMGPDERGYLLRGARVFVERCPDCDGSTALGERAVESCCFASEVAVIDCRDCGTALVEVPM